jgi:hypothetical protein
MNPLLVEYTQRFTRQKTVVYDKFFTQFTLEEYTFKLPYLYDIENFCLRLVRALKNQEKICIYSDYDTDAVTATATMYWGLINLGFKKENLDFYAPDRFVEGYGMNDTAIRELATKFDLIISVDCGINSTSEAKIVHQLQSQSLPNDFRKNNHCDLIITDHHHLHSDLPDCEAVINPRLAEYYFHNSDRVQTIQNKAKIQIEKLNLDPTSVQKVKTWLEKLSPKPADFDSNPQKFLSASVTGVGVAWFSVLWLGYFLADLDFDNLA